MNMKEYYDEFTDYSDESELLVHDGYTPGPNRWRALINDIIALLSEDFGYETDEIEMIETTRYIFRTLDEFSNFMSRYGNKIFGDTIIITMKDESFLRLLYIKEIDMYAIDYRPSKLDEDNLGHEIYVNTYNKVN